MTVQLMPYFPTLMRSRISDVFSTYLSNSCPSLGVSFLQWVRMTKVFFILSSSFSFAIYSFSHFSLFREFSTLCKLPLDDPDNGHVWIRDVAEPNHNAELCTCIFMNQSKCKVVAAFSNCKIRSASFKLILCERLSFETF